MVNLLVRFPTAALSPLLLRATKESGLDEKEHLNIDWLKDCVGRTYAIPLEALSLCIDRKYIPTDVHQYPLDSVEFAEIEFVGRLPGGKGGFGTLLRGKGARGARTTNFESSRDLQGRRLRNAKAPERMRNWLQRKAQEKAIIKAVGGPDKFIGKAMSAQDVLKYYNITLPDGVYNPFEDQDALNQVQEELRASAAQAAVTVLDKIDRSINDERGLSDSSESVNSAIEKDPQGPESAKYQHMNEYLDVFDDF